MTDHHAHHQHVQSTTRPAPWIVRILMIALIAVIGYYLITEHTAHVLAGLPLLFLLACPLMHLFMHGGHSSGQPTQSNQTSERSGQ